MHSRPAGTIAFPRGATLLEILVAMAIAAVALAAIYGFVISTTRSFGLAEDVIEAQQTVRFIVERVTEEARWAEEVVADLRCRPTFLCADRVTLRIPGANPVRPGTPYEVTFGRDVRARTVVRRQGRTEQVVGDKVTALEFRFLTADGQTAARPDAVARVALLVTARLSPAEPERTIQTDFLLRNLRPPASAAAAVPTTRGPLWRPAPEIPAGLGPTSGQARPSTPGAPDRMVCPQPPEALRRLPPPRPEISDAQVEISDWDVSLSEDGTVVIEGKVENRGAEVQGVRITGTGFSVSGTPTFSASATVETIDSEGIESFTLRLSGGVPVVWVMLRVERYVPRSAAPLHAVLADVPLSIYRDEAMQRIHVSTTVLPAGASSRHTVCVIIADFAALPVDVVQVRVDVAAVRQPLVTALLNVRAGRATPFQVTWPAPVIATAAVTVEGIRFVEGQGSGP